MFTGIVEELGTIEDLSGARLRIRASTVLEDVVMGASIAVNGCCLTVVGFGSEQSDAGAGSATWWEADVSDETFARTSLRTLVAGDRVNLERPVRLVDRLGGHLVQGHVDAVAEVLVPAPQFTVALNESLSRYVVEKGSITLDGVSLTVVEVTSDSLSAAVIPHTCEVTTLGRRSVGSLVNLEVDVMAKYAESLLGGFLPDAARSGDDDGS